MFLYLTLVHFYKHHDFLIPMIVLFITKLHRILLNSGKSVGTLRPKQKRKMKEFKKKRKKVIFTVFAPPHYLSRVRRYSLLLLCESPKCHVFITRRQGEGGTMSSLNLVSIYIWHHLSHQCQLNRLAPKLSGLHLDEQVVQGRVRSGPCMGKQPVLR